MRTGRQGESENQEKTLPEKKEQDGKTGKGTDSKDGRDAFEEGSGNCFSGGDLLPGLRRGH